MIIMNIIDAHLNYHEQNLRERHSEVAPVDIWAVFFLGNNKN